jgi:SAM-dependent methyltransferase
VPPDVSPVNRGNEYPPILVDILSELPTSAVVVDLGGGDRRHPDSRVLNLEYLPYRAVDLFGDGLCLPIASQSVDLVLSQAVLEHVTNPQKAVEEMFRILKPGGQVYADFAFMQPLHAVPHHYFNITPQGASFLFKEFDTIDQGTYGGSRDTLAWIFRLVNAEVILGDTSSSLILEQLATLESQLSSPQLAHFASVVFVHARKPLR